MAINRSFAIASIGYWGGDITREGSYEESTYFFGEKKCFLSVEQYLEEVGAAEGVDGPLFGVVEVGVAAVDGEVGVGQRAAAAVERVAVAVLAALEADLDVHLGVGPRLRERQLRHVRPHLRVPFHNQWTNWNKKTSLTFNHKAEPTLVGKRSRYNPIQLSKTR